MGYHYDPILCMNVPDSTSKAKDAKPLSKMDMNELRALYVSLGGDIKRTYGTSKQAMILKIDDLKRKGKDVPQSSFDKAIDENYIVSGMKSQLGQMLKRYKDPKNKNQLVSQYIGVVNNHRANGKVTEEEFNEFVKYAKGLVGGSHDALDKAIMTTDEEKVVGYREINNETRKAKVGDVEVYMSDTGSDIVDFTVNWPSIGYVTPDKALSFARDLMKAASNAKKLKQKYKGYKIEF